MTGKGLAMLKPGGGAQTVFGECYRISKFNIVFFKSFFKCKGLVTNYGDGEGDPSSIPTSSGRRKWSGDGQ